MFIYKYQIKKVKNSKLRLNYFIPRFLWKNKRKVTLTVLMNIISYTRHKQRSKMFHNKTIDIIGDLMANLTYVLSKTT